MKRKDREYVEDVAQMAVEIERNRGVPVDTFIPLEEFMSSVDTVGHPTFSDSLRARLNTPCPTCGQFRRGSIRRLAKDIGVHPTTLWRFLRGGAGSSSLIDAIVAYLDRTA